MDLAAILVILVALSGLVTLYDMFTGAPKRKAKLAALPGNANEKEINEAASMHLLVDLSRSLLPIFILVLVLRSFFVEPFRIPSGSMMPTLLVGDFILVNKFRYGIRLPVLNTKIVEMDKPERGDVVVFRYPENPDIPFIKRVVGLPGDHIAYHHIHKIFYVNGDPMPQKLIGTYQGVGAGSNMTGAEERTETLDKKEHDILVLPEYMPPPQFDASESLEMVIPEDEYFVLGDNRDNSRDSRYWGTVPEANLIGKAFFIWMNWDLSNGGVDWKRLFTVIN